MFPEQIKSLAREIGFDEVGITVPKALEEGKKSLQRWVSEGRHGGMKYLEDFEKREQAFYADFLNPRSVIVLGVNYYSQCHPEDGRSPDEGSQRSFAALRMTKGRVARYAWGEDYHQVIRRKHEIFISRLKEIAGDSLQAKSCVDIQPVPERFAAVKAGLGFIGKHTILLSQNFGPWLFLSEILTNLPLEEDLPETGNCGTCDHCQKICPTGALDQDYNIDARLCIAYLTIEHKGSIPVELRPKIKDWIFGCDECLNVCPFTSKSQQTKWKEFSPQCGKGEWLDMDELFAIKSNSEYEKKFRGTALMRVSRKQMLRNACVVLGNSGRPEALPYIKKAMKDSSALVREHAAWAWERLTRQTQDAVV